MYACHCTDCQRRTGSAFAISMVVRPEDLELLAGETTPYEARLPDGRIVQPGTLDQPCRLAPVLHQWVSEAQPWLTLPAGVPTYDRDPPDPGDYVRLWRNKEAP